MDNKRSTTIGRWSRALRLFLPAMMLIIASAATAQTTQVTGVVQDNTGEPLMGASVIEKGTSTGTATNLDGEFTLFVKDPAKAVLLVSYVGFETTEVALKGQTKVTVTLKEAAAVLGSRLWSAEERVGYRRHLAGQLIGPSRDPLGQPIAGHHR